MWSSEPWEGLALQREYLHFSLFLVSSGLAQGTRDLPLSIKHSTDWANPVSVKYM